MSETGQENSPFFVPKSGYGRKGSGGRDSGVVAFGPSTFVVKGPMKSLLLVS